MKRTIARTMVATLLVLAPFALTATTASAGGSYEPGSNCSVHWMPDGSLRVKLYNYTYQGAYITCYYDLWYRGEWPHEPWKSTAFVKARQYKYVTSYKARRYDWVKVTGSSIR